MTGILKLSLAVLFSSSVSLLLKISDMRDMKIWQMIAVNYLVCTAIVLAWGGWGGVGQNSPFIWSLGVFIGLLYVISLWLYHKTIQSEGLALSTTLMRLSSALPTVGSLVLFNEFANLHQIIGILLAFLSLPLASKKPLHPGKLRKGANIGIVWGLLLFFVYGVTDFTFKIQAELESQADPKAFMFVIFGSAMVLTFPGLLRIDKTSISVVIWGSLVGVSNMLATYFWIGTLAVLPGSIAYPTLGLGVIAVSSIAGMIFWQEKLRTANYIFLALAAAAILLVNLGV